MKRKQEQDKTVKERNKVRNTWLNVFYKREVF